MLVNSVTGLEKVHFQTLLDSGAFLTALGALTTPRKPVVTVVVVVHMNKVTAK